MPAALLPEEWDESVLKSQLDVETIRQFLARFRQVVDKEKEPEEVLHAILLRAFNAGVLKCLRQSAWPFLEQERELQEVTQNELAKRADCTQPTYSKIKEGQTSWETIVLFARLLGKEAYHIPLPTIREQTVGGLLEALPLVRYQALEGKRYSETLERLDFEWLLHLNGCGETWLKVLLAMDEQTGSLISACVAASIEIRVGYSVEPRQFTDLVSLWNAWSGAWDLCVAALPGWRFV